MSRLSDKFREYAEWWVTYATDCTPAEIANFPEIPDIEVIRYFWELADRKYNYKVKNNEERCWLFLLEAELLESEGR